MTATTTTDGWVYAIDYPRAAAPSDLKEFFGIPPAPDTPEQLGDNIRQKRRVWRGKQNKGRTPDARKHAEAVLSAIDEAEDAIKRGAATDGARRDDYDTREVGRTRPTSVDELWRRIELLLFRGRHQETLDLVEEFRTQFETDPRFLDLSSMVILDTAQNAPEIPLAPALLDRAVADARKAVVDFGHGESHVMTLVELLEVAGRSAEADAAYEEGARRISRPTASFRLRRLQMMSRKPDWQALLRYGVNLVRETPDDRWLRSEIVQAIVKRAVVEFLPINSEPKAQGYRAAIETAAWIADTVPEAEDFVRPHRMWAANADQPIFAGSWQWRAFFSLITGFLLLPLINKAAAKPAWSLILKGPASAQGLKRSNQIKRAERAWFLALNGFVVDAHQGVKLPWQSTPDVWPESQIQFET